MDERTVATEWKQRFAAARSFIGVRPTAPLEFEELTQE